MMNVRTNFLHYLFRLRAVAIFALAIILSASVFADQKLKVFILAGQSNTVGHARGHTIATLYKNGINPVVTFPGRGTVLYGDKTLLAKPSAFDRINVRRLFIVLEKAIATAANFTLFEFNDAFTRAQFKNLVEPFLRDVQGRRGIFDFRVVCDETNNTGEVIDRNEFIGDIYIKPARSINFIQLNFVAVRTGVDFDEVVGLV